MANGRGEVLDVFLKGYEFHHGKFHPFSKQAQWRISNYQSLSKFIVDNELTNIEVRQFVVWCFMCYALVGGDNGLFGSHMSTLWKLFPQYQQWGKLNKLSIERNGFVQACVSERERLISGIGEQTQEFRGIEGDNYHWLN